MKSYLRHHLSKYNSVTAIKEYMDKLKIHFKHFENRSTPNILASLISKYKISNDFSQPFLGDKHSLFQYKTSSQQSIECCEMKRFANVRKFWLGLPALNKFKFNRTFDILDFSILIFLIYHQS